MSMRATADVLVDNLRVAALPPPVDPPVPTTGARAEFTTNPGGWDGRSITLESQVQQPLNLSLTLKSRAQFPALAQVLKSRAADFHQGVLGLRYVHFARFLPSSDYSQLLVITAFDGDFESYLMDFVGVIGELFNEVMVYIKNAPPLPVERYPDEFMAFIRANNYAAASVLSAYPHLTALDIQYLSGIRGNDLLHRPSPRRLPLPSSSPSNGDPS